MTEPEDAGTRLDNELRATAMAILRPAFERNKYAASIGHKYKTEDSRWALVRWIREGGEMPTPTARDLGYSDGQRRQPTWRQILKPEYLAEYDEGFYAGQAKRLGLRIRPSASDAATQPSAPTEAQEVAEVAPQEAQQPATQPRP
jgi:hypothetical protein